MSIPIPRQQYRYGIRTASNPDDVGRIQSVYTGPTQAIQRTEDFRTRESQWAQEDQSDQQANKTQDFEARESQWVQQANKTQDLKAQQIMKTSKVPVVVKSTNDLKGCSSLGHKYEDSSCNKEQEGSLPASLSTLSRRSSLKFNICVHPGKSYSIDIPSSNCGNELLYTYEPSGLRVFAGCPLNNYLYVIVSGMPVCHGEFCMRIARFTPGTGSVQSLSSDLNFDLSDPPESISLHGQGTSTYLFCSNASLNPEFINATGRDVHITLEVFLIYPSIA